MSCGDRSLSWVSGDLSLGPQPGTTKRPDGSVTTSFTWRRGFLPDNGSSCHSARTITPARVLPVAESATVARTSLALYMAGGSACTMTALSTSTPTQRTRQHVRVRELIAGAAIARKELD